MAILEITADSYREEFNRLAQHPLQSWEWGEFRTQTGVSVVRYGIFDGERLIEPIQITIHPIPHTAWTVGYFPKGYIPTAEQVAVLKLIAAKHRCIFIKLEPKVEVTELNGEMLHAIPGQFGLVPGRPLFTQYNFVLDVRPTEEELLAQCKQKTRYNIRVAEKRGVTVALDNSQEAFEQYLALTAETTKRQGFYAHSRKYHEQMWQSLHDAGIAHLLTARYEGHIITTWVLFKFNDTLYYPYGASTREHREVMANNLVMWEAIKLAKSWDLKYLDMWGALGREPDAHDPWYGFHTFKSGYGARHVQYVGTWDYVAHPLLYKFYRLGEQIRWAILRLRK